MYYLSRRRGHAATALFRAMIIGVIAACHDQTTAPRVDTSDTPTLAPPAPALASMSTPDSPDQFVIPLTDADP